jgi:transcriptional repressor NF-X1
MEFICGEAPVNLDCSTYCERVKQKRIAHAMDDCVFEETDQDDNYCDDLGYYDDTIREYYRDNFRACRKIELEMLQLVKSKQQNTINFRPMKKPLRAFIHRYAKHFNLESKSVDAEPQRSVVLRKGLGACRIPPYLLHSAAYDATQNQYVNLPPSKQDPPINAFYFSGAAFGLPEDKMEYLVAQLLNSNKNENNSSIQQQQQQIRLVRMPEKDAILLISKAEQVDSDRVTLLFKQCKRELKQALPFIQVDCCHVDDKNQILWSERPNLIQPSKELKVTKKKKKQKPIKPANIFELLINEQDGPEDDDWVLLP